MWEYVANTASLLGPIIKRWTNSPCFQSRTEMASIVHFMRQVPVVGCAKKSLAILIDLTDENSAKLFIGQFGRLWATLCYRQEACVPALVAKEGDYVDRLINIQFLKLQKKISYY